MTKPKFSVKKNIAQKFRVFIKVLTKKNYSKKAVKIVSDCFVYPNFKTKV